VKKIEHEYDNKRSVPNDERLELFLQASRNHRDEHPHPDLWRVANLAALEVDELRLCEGRWWQLSLRHAEM